MTAPAYPEAKPQSAPLVVVSLDQLAEMLDTIVTKRLRQQATPAHSIPIQHPPKAAFRTRKQTAEALGISLTTVNTRLHDGTIPFQRIGRRILIPESFFTALDSQPQVSLQQ